MDANICGIVQVGVGVPDLKRSFDWYRRHFGMDIPVLQDTGSLSANMLPLTGGLRPHRILAIIFNIQGGGGIEICQFTERHPTAAHVMPQLGDCGINLACIKARDVRATHRWFTHDKVDVLSDVMRDCVDRLHFFVRDHNGVLFQVTEADDWFTGRKFPTGGICGFIAGVSEMDRSLAFYRDLLGYDSVLYDEEGTFDNLSCLAGGSQRMRRVLLTQSAGRRGAFSELLGVSRIELIQCLGRTPRRIYDRRIWGDLGLFQVAFDVKGMPALEHRCNAAGFRFILNSKSAVDVGEASAHYSYVADPDGTWVEFIETRRIPLIKAIGWYLDLTRRQADRPIPAWMLKALRFNRIKD